jgi:Holliday junction resolvase RusA-like endonuclease
MKEYNSEFIQIKPMSINVCFQGRRFRTSTFKKWQDLIICSLPAGSSKSKSLAMSIYIYLKDMNRSDLDNYIKPLIDCCVKKGIILDDRYIKYLEVIKRRAKKDGFEIKIMDLSTENKHKVDIDNLKFE